MQSVKKYSLILFLLFFLLNFSMVCVSFAQEFQFDKTYNSSIFKKTNNVLKRTLNDWVVMDTITVEDSTITLDGNLIIESSGYLTFNNVTLFMGQPNSENYYQIYAKPGSQFKIYDSQIRPTQDEYRFIFIVDSSDFVLKSSVLERIENRGLLLVRLNGAVIQDNTINHYEQCGIQLDNSTDLTIQDNTISLKSDYSMGVAIALNNSHNNTINKNYLYHHWGPVTLNYSWNNYIVDNEALLSGGYGISLDNESGNNVIVNNSLIMDLANLTNTPCAAFRVTGIRYPTTIVGNTIQGFRNACLIHYSSNIIFANNQCTDLIDSWNGGFHIFHSHHLKILNNNVSSSNPNNGPGMYLVGSHENEIKGNQIADAKYSIYLFLGSDNNIIEGNSFLNNRRNMVIMESDQNQILRNNFYKNYASSENIQAYDNGNNNWSQNYFDDYVEAGADSLGYYPIPDSAVDLSYITSSHIIQPVPVPNLVPVEFQDFSWRDTVHYSFEGDTVLENQTIELIGNIDVSNGVRLTIRNCTFLGTHPNHQIIVNDGGSLEIYNSAFIGDGVNSYFSIGVSPGATLVMKESKLINGTPWGGSIHLLGDNAIIENCKIIGSETAIRIEKSSNHIIKDNKITKGQMGILTFNSSDNLIENNYFSYFTFNGIYLTNNVNHNNQIISNTFENLNIGLHFSANDNNIFGNTFYNCAVGILSGSSSSNNIICQNNFLNNGRRFNLSSIYGISSGNVHEYSNNNQWDNENMGNYWSDYLEHYPYAQEHPQFSGIWNTPYIITEGKAEDRFPLMQKVTSVNEGRSNNLSNPLIYELLQNYPNPFNSSTIISFQIPEANHISLVIYNLIGEVVEILVDEVKQKGNYSVKWYGKNRHGNSVASGIYFFELRSKDFIKTSKMVLIK